MSGLLAKEQERELIVGLYDRGFGSGETQKVINIGRPSVLKSGIWSPYLIDLRPALSIDSSSHVSPQAQLWHRGLLLKGLCDGVDKVINTQDRGSFHIYGLPESGTPLASAVAAVGKYSLIWQRVGAISAYGSHSVLEGSIHPGQKIVQIDDVVTSGLTKNQGAEVMARHKLDVVGNVVFFDREQGGKEAILGKNTEFMSLVTASKAFTHLWEASRISQSDYDFLMEYTSGEPPRQEPISHPWKIKP